MGRAIGRANARGMDETITWIVDEFHPTNSCFIVVTSPVSDD
jgi:hypothetical protein